MLTAAFYLVVILALFCIGCLAERLFPHLGESIFPEPVPDMDAMVAQSRESIPEARELDNIRSFAYWQESDPELAKRVEQIWASGAYRRNFGGSPANQRQVPYVEPVGHFCPVCGTRLDSPERICPFAPHDRSAA